MAKFGQCKLCGQIGQLSFEHVPPRAAFNDQPIRRGPTFEQLVGSLDPDFVEKHRGGIEQRGMGAYTLCGKCNSDTGAWYGNAYADWAYQGMRYAHFSRTASSLYFTFHIFPLRVIKEIICMFFSINHGGFRNAQPGLERFVLDKERKYLDPRIRVFAHYTLSTRSRNTGVVGLLNADGNGPHVFSELTFPPWGYVLALDSQPHDERLVDISFFSRYSYNDWKDISLRFPVLPIHSWVPGDYRNRDEIAKALARSGSENQ